MISLKRVAGILLMVIRIRRHGKYRGIKCVYVLYDDHDLYTDHIELIHGGYFDVHMHNINDYQDPLFLSIIP